jgi:sugar phosphate isomerase/epimerase
MLGLENNGGIVATAHDLLTIVRAVKSPWFGVNLDTGNFHSADPYADLARCVPYAVNVQYKVEMHREGTGPKEPADAARVVNILRDGGYQGFVALEYEAAGNPHDAVPRHLRELRDLLG